MSDRFGAELACRRPGFSPWLLLALPGVLMLCSAGASLQGATVFATSPGSITVEDGPGGSVPKTFSFDVTVTDVAELWNFSFDVHSPTDGPGTTKPSVTAITGGSWWVGDFAWSSQSWGAIAFGDQSGSNTQSGTGAVAHVVVSYEGVSPGTYTLTFANVELVEPGPAAIDRTVQSLTIQVQAGVAPTPNPMAWATSPHAVSTSEIQMTAAQATDDHSPAAEIECQFEVDGTPSAWQTSRDYAHPGLAANSSHTYRVRARDGVGNANSWSSAVAVATLPAAPSATCDRASGPAYPPGSAFTFTNAAGFGAGGVDHYHYVWDHSAGTIPTGADGPWSSGTLVLTQPVQGTFYLHLASHNCDHASGGVAHYGPYLVAAVATVHVDDDNATGVEDGTETHPFNTIQEGVNAVAAGGTVKVARGTYRESIVIDAKQVSIRGGYVGGTYPGTGDFADAGRDPNPETNNTLIDGGGAAVAITCQGTGARGSALSAFKVRNRGAVFRGGLVLHRVAAIRP